MCFSDVVDSGGVVQWICSVSDRHLCRSRLSTSVCISITVLTAIVYYCSAIAIDWLVD